ALILKLSLSELTQQLKDGSLNPDNVLITCLSASTFSYDCRNPIYGQTVNPHNPQKTPGGSTGGEAALIGGGGSLLGIGTDLGGSIRLPSSFCGICGFKPTAHRLSLQGFRSICRGQKSASSSPGPMARDVDSLALCMQALLCDHMFSLDPTVPPLPFNMEIYRSSRPLRIGYLENDGYLQPTPSMVRGVREVKALLEQAGHTVRRHHTHVIVTGLYADGATTLLQKLKGGLLDPSLKQQVFIHSLPKWFKKILSFLLKPDYIQETIAHWRSCNIDVLLSPMIGPATAVSCTMLYNLLKFPAGVVPVSTVTAKDEEELKHYKGCYQDSYDKSLKEVTHTMTGGEGLPVAVQCVALPWQDELCLRFMKEVEQLVKESKKLSFSVSQERLQTSEATC
uniref:Fatty acid amide hydrolase n=1 Tax=Neolamprologus brichardi TaxID=32507 RepID=A0A3Q4I5N6_NEOBR